MNSFKDLFEANKERAIFFSDYNNQAAERKAKELYKYLSDEDNNSLVTVDSVNVEDGDTDDTSMLHIIGDGPAENWKKLVRQVVKKFNYLEFERLIP